ncbi:hypothetical protein C8R45DRAFT_1221882 [Mycena sanguinolenta]|nr:hypothetical protein C8R45DRAFT_1221882 [Mycena sanguinolenta]
MPVSFTQPPQPTSSPTTSKVFCGQCGAPGEGRFCTECGTRLASSGAATSSSNEPPPYNPADGSTKPSSTFSPPATSSGGTAASVAQAGFVNQPAMSAPYQQQESPTALFGSQGYRLDAFHHIAREIFVALDRSTFPAGTQMIEASKLRRFRELGGKPIPPYFESHVLPMYYQTIGAQRVGGNVLSWEGWNTYLAHKILASPDEMFAQLGAVLRGLNVQLPWPLVRTDFPAYAYPDAAAREMQFQQGIRDLAGSALGANALQQQQQHSMARRKLMSGLISNSFQLFN